MNETNATNEINATNSPTTSSPLSPSLLRAVMADARRTTEQRESARSSAELKAKERKARMLAAQQLKAANNAEEKAKEKEKEKREKEEKKRLRVTATEMDTTCEDESKSKSKSKSKSESESATRHAHSPLEGTTGRKRKGSEKKKKTKKKEDNNQATKRTKRATCIRKSKRPKIEHSPASAPHTSLSLHPPLSFSSSSSPPVHVVARPRIVGDPNKEPACRMRKYKLEPTAAQMTQLRKAVGVTTWTYNQCVGGVRSRTVQHPRIADLRTHFLNSKAPLVQDKAWVTEVPYDLRDEAAKDFAQAWKANETKKKKGDVHAVHAAFQFQNKHRKSRKLVIHAKHYWGPGVFHPSFFGYQAFRCRETLPDRLRYDATLTLNWLGHVHLYVPAPLEKHARVGAHAVAPNPIVAIDPGVRTFGTLYDPTNQRYIEWGRDDVGRIYRLCHYADDLQSRMGGGDGVSRKKKKTKEKTKTKKSPPPSSTSTAEPSVESPPSPHPISPSIGARRVRHHARWRMKRALRRMRERIHNLVKDFHFKYAK